MTKKMNLVWRLEHRPTSNEVVTLMEQGIITKEEAREILFSSKETEDTKALKEEIVFLRALVDTLSKGSRTTIVETIREVEVPYRKSPWYSPYQIYCSDSSGSLNIGADSSIALQGSNDLVLTNNADGGFTAINTFNTN